MNIGELVTVKTIENKNTIDEKHTPYGAEIRLFSCVQQGDIESLITQLKNLDSHIIMGKMSDDELMQHKYMAVSTITLATRYAIQGGLNENKAYEFSDRVIKTIDKLTDKNEIFMCLGIEIVRLTEDVKKNKKQPEFSPHIRNCIKYINENLSEKISVSAVAKYCGISADYLSQIFKREIGENLSSYIVRQKLEKAKNLLISGMSSKEICIEVGFSSQAYFVTLFKRYYNMTPSEYVKLAKSEL
ncbi:MAG: helix-turn-helix domain-containing protein [Ruminococcaceae bacterium]|nr:helix-turn-helix domain-containing protein [Oscillospiraceae bacterium]MBR3597368.1 helix-turn-helix transcriptional regulator [Clostridia bacterium]